MSNERANREVRRRVVITCPSCENSFSKHIFLPVSGEDRFISIVCEADGETVGCEQYFIIKVGLAPMVFGYIEYEHVTPGKENKDE